MTTDRTPAYPRVLDEVVPAACHVTEQDANNVSETNHGRLKARLWPMRGLTRLRSARVISAGHAFIQNLRRGYYELGIDITRHQSAPRGSGESIDPALLAKEPGIPWMDVAGMRNHLAHRYFDTAHSIVQATVTDDLPPLVVAVERLLVRTIPGTQE